MNLLSEQNRLIRAREMSSRGVTHIPELISMLTDSSWSVRRAVIQSLAQLGKGAVPMLIDVLLTKRDNEARIAAAVDTLVMIPADIEEDLSVLVKHADPAVVADAAQILGRRRNHSSIATLVQLTKHPDDNVAVGAIEGLGRIGGRSAVEAMVESIKTENFFRVFPAIDVLGRSGDPRATEPLAQLLDNPTYLLDAARALGKTGERAAVRPLVKILNSNVDAFVRVAATALLELRQKYTEKSGGDELAIDELIKTQSQPETVRRLLRVLSNSDVSESIAICKCLGAIGSAEAAQSLTSALDSAPSVATAAAEALRRIEKDTDESILSVLREGSSARRKALLPIVQRFAAAEDVAECLTDEDAEVRALACEALVRIGNGSVVDKVFPLLADFNMRVVHAAVAAIQALGTKTAREMVLQTVKSQIPAVRRSAVRILSYFGDDSALAPMLAALKDPDLRVQELALQGLPYLESPLALEALIDVAKGANAKARALAVRSLGLVPNISERVISILLSGLSDEDAWVRYYSCQSLGRLQYESATPEIVKLLQDPAGQVRVSAVEALSHFKSTEAHQFLREAAGSEEVEIRRAALVGLGFAHRSEDLPVILAGVQSPDLSTRLMALSALSSFTSSQATEALCAAAMDVDDQVSSTAINFIAARPEESATRFLVTLLGHEATRARAQTALQVSSKGRLSALLEILESANDELAPSLISVISRMERADARKGLLSAMKLRNPAARRAAASGLAARHEPELISALQEAAEFDEDQEVRHICKLLLHD